MNDVVINMGRRITHRRKALNLSQKAVAALTGLTVQTISYAENGRKSLRPESIVLLADALSTTPNYLLLGDNVDLSQSLSEKAIHLTPHQRSCLNNIIQNFLDAVQCD